MMNTAATYSQCGVDTASMVLYSRGMIYHESIHLPVLIMTKEGSLDVEGGISTWVGIREMDPMEDMKDTHM